MFVHRCEFGQNIQKRCSGPFLIRALFCIFYPNSVYGKAVSETLVRIGFKRGVVRNGGKDDNGRIPGGWPAPFCPGSDPKEGTLVSAADRPRDV